tara:strand:- start:2014 stop:2556 length:543 start_codon:yes stop_codon:yes gene_type:complete
MANFGQVIWITGLSGTGKSTLGKELASCLRNEFYSVIMLDGDELREIFGASEVNEQNYSRNCRLALAMKYSKLCKTLANQGLNVVIATISLFKEIHLWNRSSIPGYYEVYMKVPISVLRRRDSKKIYQQYDTGMLKNVAGLDLIIDEPTNADLVLEYQPDISVKDLAKKLTKTIRRRICK